MAYLTHVEKLAEGSDFVEYSYSGSGWDGSKGIGRFQIHKVTEEITVSEEVSAGPAEKYADCGIWAVLKRWRETGEYPVQASWAS